jgi:glycogen debranching enzyme
VVQIFFNHFYKTMKTINRLIFIFFLCSHFPMNATSQTNDPVPSLDDLAIIVTGESREVVFTNKEAGHYYTLTGSYHTSGWQGWTVMDVRLLDDYLTMVGSNDLLRTRDHATVGVKPHAMTRTYPDGTRETFTLLDSVNAFIVDIELPDTSVPVSFHPLFTQSHSKLDYLVHSDGRMLSIGLKSYDEKTAPHPGWIAITTTGENPAFVTDPLPPEPVDPVSARTFAPAGVTVGPVKSVRFIVTAGKNEAEAKRLARYVSQNGNTLITKRAGRMQRLLGDSYIRTSDSRFNKALAWARISMDALIMNQTGTGIYAGLPWFNNYWGRDTFISFSGGTLVTGQFDTAPEILRSFARFQDTDPASRTYGRVPNRVTTQEIIYNTTDGTPWFVRELYQYYLYSGDASLIRELFPVVRRSIEGALRNYADDRLFLTHADADTWMDAVGPDGPWSPRGNRAVDIQYLWYRQLTDGAAMAALCGDPERANQWNELAQTLRKNFNEDFIDKERKIVYDRLLEDGTPDARVRPNQIFAFDMVDEDYVRKEMLRTLIGELTFPWGVASLSMYDEQFHPYHHYQPYYVPDAAYHNGIVWTWLIGPVIRAAVRYDLQDIVFGVTENMVHQILERGGVGTFSELLDAFPRQGEEEPRLSGTFTQAWNLAEFIRTAYQDYLGVHVDAASSEIVLTPKMPQSLGNIEAKIPVGQTTVLIDYARERSVFRITVRSDDIGSPLNVRVNLTTDDGDGWEANGPLQPGEPIIFEFSHDQITISPGTHADFRRIESASRRDEFVGLRLAQPEWQEYWVSLTGPDYPLLRHAVVKREPVNARLLYDIEDEKHDDTGPIGTYTYPTNPNFADGILDITRFTVWEDEGHTRFRLRFRNLHDPGYHPEYGFQLTYAAILIDRGEEGNELKDAGMNSHYYIAPELGTFDRAIYVGGGLRVVDGEENILCEYLPAPEDVVQPLGNVREKEISFSIPNIYLGEPDERWRYLVLVGAQDDHGGAGIGVFRSVQETAGEWHGGGKVRPGDTNVYDVILPGEL